MATGRLAILNGFGRSLGDSLVGLQALSVAQTLAAMPVPVLVRRHYGRPLVDQMYKLADFAEVTNVPDDLPDTAPEGSGEVIDMRDFAFDPAFCATSMIDYFLSRLGLEPHRVPATLKRNAWLRPRIRTTRPPGLSSPYALVCPGSSMPMRDMPPDMHALVLERLTAVPELLVVTQGRSSLDGVTCLPSFTDIEDLCSLVAHAEMIVSTDTAMVHLADAFDVPVFAVFTTHRPQWRVRDYPGCDALYLPVPELPASLEFARGPADIDAVCRAWHHGEAEFRHRLDAFLFANSGRTRRLAGAGYA